MQSIGIDSFNEFLSPSKNDSFIFIADNEKIYNRKNIDTLQDLVTFNHLQSFNELIPTLKLYYDIILIKPQSNVG